MMPPTSLRLAYRTFAGFERALRRQVSAFHASHPDVDVNVTLRDFDLPELHQRMIDGNGCNSGDWDMFLCITDWLPRLMERGALLALDPYLDRSPPANWPDGWSQSLRGLQCDESGGVFGVPYHDGPEMFMYRSDLFEDPAERARFQREHGYPLAVPETWSEFRDVARFFTRPSDDLYGCVLAAMADGHNSVYDFFIHLWSRGGLVLDGRRAAFNGPAGREALQFITDLMNVDRVTQPGARSYESVRSGEFYSSGRGAMMWNWAGFAVVADMPDSKVRGKTKLGLIPRGDGPQGRHVALSAYWVLTIPSGSRNPELAWKFLSSVLEPEMDKITALEGAIGCRLSTWRDPEIQRRFPPYALMEETHRSAETLPPIPELDRAIEILNTAIDDVHRGDKPVGAALDDAARAVDEVLAA